MIIQPEKIVSFFLNSYKNDCSDINRFHPSSVGNKEMGLVSSLLKWNEKDPPSREEKLRNDRICKFYQHNRNPFVDHPEYADLIWKQISPTRESLKVP